MTVNCIVQPATGGTVHNKSTQIPPEMYFLASAGDE